MKTLALILLLQAVQVLAMNNVAPEHGQKSIGVGASDFNPSGEELDNES